MTDTSEMSLRDWFAGQALIGYMTHLLSRLTDKEIAGYCYGVADAMLAERKKKPSNDSP